MLHFLLAALLATVHVEAIFYDYERTGGACRGGESPDKNAGLVFYRDRDCEARCNAQDNCTGYVLPQSASSWCETYKSKGATGDYRKNQFWCFMKGDEKEQGQLGARIQNLCRAEEEGGPKTCACYNGYDATCRTISTGEEDCKNAGCLFANDKCKGQPKGTRLKCKKIKYVTVGGDPMCNCMPGCTVESKPVKQRVRRRRANKNPKKKFKCKGKSFKFD